MSLLNGLYRQAEDYFFAGISSRSLSLGDGATAYMTGIPAAELNLIYGVKSTGTLDEILNQGSRFFDQDRLPFCVIIRRCAPEAESLLRARDYHRIGQSVSMAISLNEFVFDCAPGFEETFICANDHQLNEWRIPLEGAFESTLEISLMYALAHEKALKKGLNLRHFSLYKQEEPLASATLSMHGVFSRIDDVSTLPKFQGQGYATHLMRYLLAKAKAQGACYCFLESSDLGLGVYQKLGFSTLFKNDIYSQTP